MTTPFEGGVERETKEGILLADIAKAAGIKHFVYTSVGSATRNTGIPHFDSKFKVEQHIKKLGLPYTILRPVFFMENLGTPWFLPQQGTLVVAMNPKTKIQMISVKDIGEFAVAALIEPERFLGKEIELAGDSLTFPEVADILSKAMGQKVVFQQIPFDQVEKAAGHDMALMFKWFNDVGYNVDIEALRKDYGIPLTKFTEVVATADWAKPHKVAT